MKQRIKLLREFSVPLVAGVVLALAWANLDAAGYQAFIATPFWGELSFYFVSNELFMTLFFGIAAVEITQSCMPGGDLNPLSRAVNPLFGTLGGVLGPVLLYLGLNSLVGLPELRNGWGIPTATDIALAWLAARAVFGPGHPAVSYLLLLAVADDAIGLAIIALFYPDPGHPVAPAWLLLTCLGMLLAWGLRTKRATSYWPYILLGGGLSWWGLHRAHLHPALALVFIVPFLPSRVRESGHLFDDDPGDRSPLARFEHEWKAVVDFGLFLFGLANAGVAFASIGTVTWLVLFSLLLGKTAGIFGFGMLAERFGFRRPRGMKRRDLLVAGVVAGTGFTVALFVSGSAFSDPVIQGAAKMGAMFSLTAALLGLLLGHLLRIRKVY